MDGQIPAAETAVQHMKKHIIFFLITGCLVLGCTKPKDLEFVDLSNLRMIKWGLTESEIGIDVRLYNPNNQRVQIKEPAAKVYANSSYLGDARLDSIVTVPRRDTFSIPLVLRIQTLSAVSRVLEVLSDTTVDIRVEGNVKMGKGGVFLNYPIQYHQLHRLSELKY